MKPHPVSKPILMGVRWKKNAFSNIIVHIGYTDLCGSSVSKVYLSTLVYVWLFIFLLDVVLNVMWKLFLYLLL